MKIIYSSIFLFLLALFLSTCFLPSERTKSPLSLEDTAEEAIQLLKTKDMERLSEHIHPNDGVRFSPYGYVDLQEDVVFTTEQMKNGLTDETVYQWGYFDGTGEPIKMTFKEYYDRFVYDEDYVNAEEISYNKRLGHGNSIDNTKEVYPGATIVEYHFPGFIEEYEGMDWRSLRFVLIEENNRWYLVGIIHDEWTS
ncbi:hypothetical protein [Halalkalibacter krulwichiae]|uniref:Uncharacterized protein n=1 Tax=Halalkalibacter krulwichiae TaxID=199441 RepID=A0A1X9MF28_9BACI|nr:hypothetical protein [Halalkalibacter krulwichiae]ARK32026.1 hypothetical protein BkAM31D_20485 [Halalkalibacter krulwichiae]